MFKKRKTTFCLFVILIAKVLLINESRKGTFLINLVSEPDYGDEVSGSEKCKSNVLEKLSNSKHI